MSKSNNVGKHAYFLFLISADTTDWLSLAPNQEMDHVAPLAKSVVLFFLLQGGYVPDYMEQKLPVDSVSHLAPSQK